MILNGKRIIYIEDDLRNRIMVQTLLEAEGAKTMFERWGTPGTALSVIAGYLPVDLILLDLMLGYGYSGYDILHAIRQQPMFQGIPVVMISAADASVEMPKARDLGVASYLSKPIDAPLFAHQIADILAGTSIWETL